MNSKFETEFARIESFLFKGDYEKILSLIQAIEKWEKLSNEEMLKILKIKTVVAMEKGEYEKAFSYLKEIEQLCPSLKSDMQLIECNILRIEVLNYKGEFKESLNLILATEILLGNLTVKNNFFKHQLAKLLRLKGICYQVTGRLERLNEIFEKSIELCDEIDDDFEKSNSLDAYAMFLGRHDSKKSLKYIIESKEIRKKIGNPIYLSKTYNRFAIIQYNLGNYDEALLYYNNALELASQNNHREMIAIINMNIGNIHKQFGRYNQALEHYLRTIKIYEELGNQYLIANGKVNIADIYRLRGELNKALNYLEQALERFETLGQHGPIATTLTGMGRIFYNINDFKKSRQVLERALKLREESNSSTGAVGVLFHLIQISLDENKLDKAKEYLEKIEKYHKKDGNRNIEILFNLSEAFVLKTSTRFQNRVKAEDLLKKIINDKNANHEWKLISYVVLADILIDELKLSGEQELLNEIKNLTDNLINAAKSSHSNFVLIESLRLQSQLSLIEMDYEKSKNLLIQCLLIAEEKELHRYIKKIGNEYDKLIEQEKMWKRLPSQELSIKERVSLTNIDQIMFRMTKIEDQEIKEIEIENPVYLLILDKSGKTLYTQKFLELTKLDGALMGGFLAAINSFVSEIFETTGHLERIKHQNYTIIIKVEDSLLFSYIYKGESFGALSKLNSYVERIKSSNYIWESLKDATRTPSLLELPVQKELEKKAEIVFLSS